MPDEEDDGLKRLLLKVDYHLVSPTVTQEEDVNTSEKKLQIKKNETNA